MIDDFENAAQIIQKQAETIIALRGSLASVEKTALDCTEESMRLLAERSSLSRRVAQLEMTLREVVLALHEKDENHPALVRPDWSKEGPGAWTILKGCDQSRVSRSTPNQV